MEKRQKLIPFPRIGKRQALIPFPRTGKRSGSVGSGRLMARPAARSKEEEPEFIRLANGLTLLSRNNNGKELRIVGKNG